MNTLALRNKVSRALALDREIAEKTNELKALKKDLIKEAKTRKDEHRIINDGGTYVEWRGHGDDYCRVTFPKPTLKSSIALAGAIGQQLIALCPPAAFKTLFSRTTFLTPTGSFRKIVKGTLDGSPGAAAKVTKLCTSNTQPRVSFETKEAEAAQ